MGLASTGVLGKPTPPVEVSLEFVTPPRTGEVAELRVHVHAQVDLPDARIAVSIPPGFRLESPGLDVHADLERDRDYTFVLRVKLVDAGDWSLEATVVAEGPRSRTVARAGLRVRAGPSSAVVERLERMPPPGDDERGDRYRPSAEPPASMAAPTVVAAAACNPATQIVVTGKALFAPPGCADGSFTTRFSSSSSCAFGSGITPSPRPAAPGCVDRPLRRARVELRQLFLFSEELIAVGLTDDAGNFSFCLDNSPSNPADFTVVVQTCAHGDGEECGRENGAPIGFPVVVTDASDLLYTMQPSTSDTIARDVCVGTASWEFVDRRATSSAAEYVFDLLATLAYDVLSQQVGWQNLFRLQVAFPGETTAFFPGLRLVHLLGEDFHDPDVILHEYAHHVMYTLYDGALPSTPNCNPHHWGVHSSPACGFVEGWATFLQGAMQQDRTYEDSPFPGAPASQVYEIDVEPPDPAAHHVEDEGATTATLWDLFDGEPEQWDGVALGLDEIWETLRTTKPADLCLFAAAWRARGIAVPVLEAIAEHHDVFCSALEVVDPNPKLLEDGFITLDAERRATGGVPRNGAAADGVTRLLLRAPVPSDGFATFELDGPYGDGADGFVTNVPGIDLGTSVIVTTVETAARGHMAYAFYQVPPEFNPPNGAEAEHAERTVGLRMHFRASAGGGAVDYETKVRLVRPPLVLMHGLWSDGSAFAHFALPAGRFLVIPGDYRATNAAAFAQNQLVSRFWSRQAVEISRARGNAATQVDLVGHSMGGILARLHAGLAAYERADNFHEGDLHKLVTIDTPHLGSPLASLIASAGAVKRAAIDAIMGAAGRHTDHGAVEDLAIGSDALFDIGRTRVPSHAVVGEGSRIAACKSSNTAEELLYDVLVPLFFPGTEEQDLFHSSQHDCIVSSASQQGGLPASSRSFVTDASGFHTAITASDAAAGAVTALLNAPATGAAFSFFPAPILVSGSAARMRAPARQRTPVALVEALSITSPADGAVVVPGQIVDVTVMGAADIVAVGVAGPGTAVLDDVPPFTLSLTIPIEAAGSFGLRAVGRDRTGGYVVSAPRTITVDPAAPLAGITVVPEMAILFARGDTRQVTVFGLFEDDITRDVSAAELGTTYVSSDPAVVRVSPDGLLTAVGAGQASITVMNGVHVGAVLVDSRDEACGNDLLEGDEECDDGNVVGGDGCDAACLIEVAVPTTTIVLPTTSTTSTTSSSTTLTTTAPPSTTSSTAPPNQDPDCAAGRAAPAVLTPATHTLANVQIEGVTDPDGDLVAVTITGIAQDEPVDGTGDGTTCPDATVVGGPVARVRAERAQAGDGRVYHLAFRADDGRGGSCTGTATVCVPKDGAGSCGDQGSTSGSGGATSCPAIERTQVSPIGEAAVYALTIDVPAAMPGKGRIKVKAQAFATAGAKLSAPIARALKPGQRTTVGLTLSKRGRKLLAETDLLRMRVTVRIKRKGTEDTTYEFFDVWGVGPNARPSVAGAPSPCREPRSPWAARGVRSRRARR